jgi:hypothetical protein
MKNHRASLLWARETYIEGRYHCVFYQPHLHPLPLSLVTVCACVLTPLATGGFSRVSFPKNISLVIMPCTCMFAILVPPL